LSFGRPPRTQALGAGSPAIDTITDGTCPPPVTDQRSVKRPQDGNGDGGRPVMLVLLTASNSSGVQFGNWKRRAEK